MQSEQKRIERQLNDVQNVMTNCLAETNLYRFLAKGNSIVGTGKMLRARMTLSIGATTGVPSEQLVRSAAAVELIHGASLLHDDVIDGGVLRRGAPTFWKKHGINGAILFGDLLVFKALQLFSTSKNTALLPELIELTAMVCQSEVEQELVLRGSPGTWEACEQIARRKTGSLFAFAAFAAAGEDPSLQDALREAGFIIGTAYQLVDDILDASANESVAGKTLGKDSERGKTTAITATKNAPSDPVTYIENMYDHAASQLNQWPAIQQTWIDYLNETMVPTLNTHLKAGQTA